jgi:hypothetical protein
VAFHFSLSGSGALSVSNNGLLRRNAPGFLQNLP